LYTSLALDAANKPHIAYADVTSDTLKYAYWTGNEWDIQVVDSAAPFVYDGYEYGITGISLALDGSGGPHISYFGRNEVKYAHWVSDTWEVQTLYSPWFVIPFGTSLALDSSGNPHIAYGYYHFDAVYDNYFALRCTRWTGSAWEIEGFYAGEVCDDYRCSHPPPPTIRLYRK
jgi:hypothetical protein